MTTAFIFDIRKYSIHDGPGIRTTVFFKGCPLVCSWCHNPEGQSPTLEVMYHENRCIRCGACVEECTQQAIKMDPNSVVTNFEECIVCGTCTEFCYSEAREIIGKEMTVEEVMTEIEKDIPFYEESNGGVTFSGGEPLLQKDFLFELLKLCKLKNIHTAIDTCGYTKWDTINEVSKSVDLFLYDLKIIDDHKHKSFTGVSNKIILENLKKLLSLGCKVSIRIPIIPAFNDDEKSIKEISDYVTSLPNVNGVSILPYHHMAMEKYKRLNKNYDLNDKKEFSKEELNRIENVFQKHGLNVAVRG